MIVTSVTFVDVTGNNLVREGEKTLRRSISLEATLETGTCLCLCQA